MENNTKNNISEWVADTFLLNGVKKVFVYPGGTITPLINACRGANITIECFKSEQGAGYAALACARLTGQPQVVMVTSGPGVTNVITPLADAYYDSTPLILITGQIGTADLTIRKEVRQRGFQETPTVAITKPISKHSVCLLSVDDVYKEVPDSFRITSSGRKGPCVIDFPMDMQRMKVDGSIIPSSISIEKEDSPPQSDKAVVKDIAKAAVDSKRPVLLLGNGALAAGGYDVYREIANKLNGLVVTSFLGIGSYDSQDKRYLGYVGHTGHIAANRAVFECDFLLVLGSRLDVRQTGTEIDQYVPEGKVAWVDIDSNELINGRVPVHWQVEADLLDFCEIFIQFIDDTKNAADQKWLKKIKDIQLQQLDDIPLKGADFLQPREVMNALARHMDEQKAVVVTGVGCHQHWAARHLPFKPETHQFLSSGGHGTMGYDLPSAIGAAMAYPDRSIVCIVGDGSLLMNIQELVTLVERRLDVKILVMNNNRLGLVSQFQLISWGDDPTTGDFNSPDYVNIAQGFGLTADRLDKVEEIGSKLNWFWQQIGPTLLDVVIDSNADVTPMLLAGQNMGEMWMGRTA